MQTFDIKKGHFKNLEDNGLENIIKEILGDVHKEGDKYVANFGAMKPITVWLQSKKELCIDIVTDKDVNDEVAMQTIRAKNEFLKMATGFSSKERSKRLKKKAKEGKL